MREITTYVRLDLFPFQYFSFNFQRKFRNESYPFNVWISDNFILKHFTVQTFCRHSINVSHILDVCVCFSLIKSFSFILELFMTILHYDLQHVSLLTTNLIINSHRYELRSKKHKVKEKKWLKIKANDLKYIKIIKKNKRKNHDSNQPNKRLVRRA